MAEVQKPEEDDQIMSTSCSIASALGNLRTLIDRTDEFSSAGSKWLIIIDPKVVKLDVEVVRTFLLCARRFTICGWKDRRLQPFLSALQDLDLYHDLTHDFDDDTLRGYNDLIRDFRAKFRYCSLEISTIYCSLRDFLASPSNRLPALADDRVLLLEFIDSLLQNLVVVPSHFDSASYRSYCEPLQEKLKFLKHFILLPTWEGVESTLLKDPMSCLQDVAIRAADFSQRLWFHGDLNTEDKHSFDQIISKVDDHQLYQTCILQALKASTFSLATLNLEKDTSIVGAFADFLTGILWEILSNYDERSFAVAKPDQIQMMYDGLRFLRTILKNQPDKFNGLHQNMKDFVGSVVNDAGILILECSISVKERTLMTRKLDLEFSDLLQKINLIRLVASTIQSPRSTIQSPWTNDIVFLKFLLKNLRELAELELVAHSKDQIRIVETEFLILEAALEKIADHRTKHQRFIAFWNRVIDVADKVMLVIFSFDLSPLSFHSILEELLHLKTDFLEIDSETYDSEAQKVAKASGYVSSQGFISILNNSAVGFKDETESIINQVRHGSEKMDIISIVGMPGLGKTTLARRIYSDPSVIRDFHIRAWCNVSQVYNTGGLILEILGCIDPEISRQSSHMDEGDLAHKLLNSLRRHRFFIVLDDVWDIDAWNILRRSFPDDKKGSRILITSRLNTVASQIQVDSEPYRLRQFTDDESWDLLQKMVFRNELWPPELCTVGKQIAQNCGGLPLTVVIVAGLLATTPQDGWKEFAERTTTRNVSIIEHSMDMLELSYRHVPDYLKPCLLYVGAFQQGQEIPIEKLLLLWIAEGFVQKVEQKNIEEVAEEYMMDLVGRSLIMVAERRRIDRVERCRIHDLIHEFCVTKAKEENFSRLLHGYDGLHSFSDSDDTGRLSIYSEPEHFEKSRLFCPHIRCLMFSFHGDGFWFQRREIDSLPIFIFCKLLRVLDLEQLLLRGGFPTELLVLVELRYLAIGGHFESIPSSIANLSNLETLILAGRNVLELPETLWNMTNLRHLCISAFFGKFVIPKDMYENSSILYNLRTLSWLRVYTDPSMEKTLSKFPNICTLKCEVYDLEGPVSDWSRVVRMDFLSQLKSLSLIFDEDFGCDVQFEFPLNLEKLVLRYFTWGMISAIEKLSNLEVLKLDYDVENYGEVRWDVPEEVEFPKLKMLEFCDLGIVRWTGSGDHFPCLQALIFNMCPMLKEVPPCLGSNSPLEMIEIRRCSSSIVSLAEEIKEEQQAMGNEDLQIIIL